MLRVLFLDDIELRHDEFTDFLRREGLRDKVVVTHVYGYDSARRAILHNQFDIACLDHDLEDFGYDGDGRYREFTGMDVMNFMMYPDMFPPKYIFIHSWNKAAVNNMANHAGLQNQIVFKQSFGPQMMELFGLLVRSLKEEQ